MSFFRGFIKEAATNETDMLKEDMKRTDERAEGMAQYRVSRRRAEQERIIKDNKDWRIFTNEVWISEDEANDYAKRNKFKKNIKWKVVPYDNKYFK